MSDDISELGFQVLATAENHGWHIEQYDPNVPLCWRAKQEGEWTLFDNTRAGLAEQLAHWILRKWNDQQALAAERGRE